MTCEVVKMADGTKAIVCSRKKRPTKCFCGKPATRLCDGQRMRHGKLGDTCDKALCDEHAFRVDADHDLCPDCLAKSRQDGQLKLEGL